MFSKHTATLLSKYSCTVNKTVMGTNRKQTIWLNTEAVWNYFCNNYKLQTNELLINDDLFRYCWVVIKPMSSIQKVFQECIWMKILNDDDHNNNNKWVKRKVISMCVGGLQCMVEVCTLREFLVPTMIQTSFLLFCSNKTAMPDTLNACSSPDDRL